MIARRGHGALPVTPPGGRATSELGSGRSLPAGGALPGGALPGGVASTAQGLSAADFSASYCPSGTFGFYFCLTNRTGDGSHDISSVDWLRAYANAYRGQVQLKLSYRNLWGNWINIYNQTVPEDTVKTVYTFDNDRYLTEVTQASGDGYHWSVYGDK